MGPYISPVNWYHKLYKCLQSLVSNMIPSLWNLSGIKNVNNDVNNGRSLVLHQLNKNITTAVQQNDTQGCFQTCFTFILFDILKERFKMNNLDEVMQILTIGLIFASFLLNTSRFLKAI